MNFYKLVFLLLLVTFVSSLNQEQYDRLLEIRTNFNLEEYYPGPEPIDFCSNESIFICSAKNSTIDRIVLHGNGSSVIPSFREFVDITELEIYNASDINHFIYNAGTYLPPSLPSIVCEYCNITKIPFQDSSLRRITLLNNPLNSEFNLTKGSAFVKIQNPDPLFANYLVRIVPQYICYTSNSYTSLSIMLNESAIYECTVSARALSIQLGSFFGPETNLSNLVEETFPSLRGDNSQLELIGNNFTFNALEIASDIFSMLFYRIQFNIEEEVKQINVSNPEVFSLSSIDSRILTNDGRFLYNTSNCKNIAIRNSGLKYIYSGMFSKANIVDLRWNGIVQPFPSFFFNSDAFVQLDYNKFYGSVDKSVCGGSISFSNNNLTGLLPSCLLCYLNIPEVKKIIAGNNFANYKDTDTVYPLCDSVQITSFSNFGNIGASFHGVNFPLFNGYISGNIPNISYSIYQTQPGIIYLSYASTNYQAILKYKELVVTIHATRDFTFRFPVGKQTPKVVGSNPPLPYLNIGYSFTFLINQLLDSNVTINVDGQYVCEVNKVLPSFDTTTVACVVKSFSIPEKLLVFSFTLQNNISFSYSLQFVRHFPILTAVSSVPKSGGLVTFYGFFGNNISISNSSDIDVTIGLLPCQIKSLEDQKIVCLIEESTLSGPQNISVNCFGVPGFYPNMFFFMEDSKDCENDCNGNGFCFRSQTSVCICNLGWGGSSCANRVYYGAVHHNGNTTEISQDQVRFGLTIVGIQEISFDGKLLKERIFDRWNQTTNNETIFSYTHLYEDSIMGYQIEEITQQRSFEFAGYNMSLDAGTFKLTANVSNWVFISSISSLQLLINTSLISSEDDCTQTEINSFGESTLTHITIEKDGKIFYGKFIDRMLSDGKPTYSSTKIVNQTSNSILLGISLPHCTQCILDPDFSILISNKDQNGCKSTTTSNRDWVVPTAVVVSIVGAAIIGTIIAVISSRFYYIKISRKGVIFIKKEKKKSGADGIQMS